MIRTTGLLAILLTACGTPPATGPGPNPGALPADATNLEPVADSLPAVGPDWLRGVLPADLPIEQWVHGAALHTDSEEAEARAEVALAMQIWGPLAQRPTSRLLPSFFIRTDDMARTELLPNGQTAVLLAINRRLLGDRILAWLDEANGQLATRQHQDSPAGRLAATIASAELRMLESFACRRIQALAAGQCPAAPAGDNPLTVLGTVMRLEPQITGGIPRLPGKLPLRPAGACLNYQDSRNQLLPWPDVPLRFDAPPGILGSQQATTGANGCATVPFAALPADNLRIVVRVEAELLVGELAADFPDVTTELHLRQVTTTSARVAVHLFENVLGRPSQETVTAEKTVIALRNLGYPNAALLEADLAATLTPAKSGAVDAALAALRAKGAGVADILVLGELHSDFLSRAIGRTLWHEANLAVRIFDLWSGTPLGEFELSTRAQGLGDEDAARNAMAEMGRTLADRLHQLFAKVTLANQSS